ncbi:MAG: O-antigen ligase family protein, partial [Pirellulaceae bacterium]
MCLLAGVVLSAFPGQRFRGLPLLACLSLLGFLGLSYLSANQSIDPEKTQFYMHFIWRIVFIAIVAVRLLDTPQKVNWMLWAIALGLGYNAYGINREYFDIGFCRYVYNSNWAWLGSNQWAMLFVCSASISFSLVFFSERLWQKALAGILLLLSAHAVMLLESRGSMLGLIGMWLLAVIFMPKNKTTIGMMALALFAVSLLVGPSVVEEFSSIFNKGDDLDSSASSRMDLWRAGWLITMEYPLLGVGPYAGQR